MPIYVYRCSACDSEFEVQQRIVEAPLTSCPEGHEGTVKRVIQPVGIAFKGSGFYVNDSAPAGASKPEAATAPAESKTPDAGASEAKSEGAPATSPTPAPAPSAPAASAPATETP